MAIESWKKNYADLELPSTWENNDYGNDELPTFSFNDGDTIWNINIDMPTQEERDERWGLNSNVKRFFVKRDQDYASTNCWFLETNSFNEVKEFCIKRQIKTIAKKVNPIINEEYDEDLYLKYWAHGGNDFNDFKEGQDDLVPKMFELFEQIITEDHQDYYSKRWLKACPHEMVDDIVECINNMTDYDEMVDRLEEYDEVSSDWTSSDKLTKFFVKEVHERKGYISTRSEK